MTIGYPFAKITSGERTLMVSSHRPAGRFAVRLEAITRAERTPHGVRIYVGDDNRFIVGHLLVGRLLTFLRRTGVSIDETITAASWTDV